MATVNGLSRPHHSSIWHQTRERQHRLPLYNTLYLIDSMTGSAIKRYIMCWGKFLVIFLLYLLANADNLLMALPVMLSIKHRPKQCPINIRNVNLSKCDSECSGTASPAEPANDDSSNGKKGKKNKGKQTLFHFGIPTDGATRLASHEDIGLGCCRERRE
jgi:hypothetical protein